MIVGPLEQEVVGFEDHLRYLRRERKIRLMQREQDFLQLSGLSAPTRSVPLKLAISLKQGASFHIEVRRSYAAIL